MVITAFSKAAFAMDPREQLRTEYRGTQGYVQFLDDTGEFWITNVVKLENMRLNGSIVRHRAHNIKVNELVPNSIVAGLDIKIDGASISINTKKAHSGNFDVEYHGWNVLLNSTKISNIQMFFYGKKIGTYEYNPSTSQFVRITNPQHISAFDFRQFYNKGLAHAKEWAEHTPSGQGESSISKVDLHTHFAGALRAEAIVRTAFKLKAAYPTKLLDEMQADYPKELVFMKDGEPHVFLSEEKMESAKNRIQSLLSIQLNETITFERMEEIYRWRSPLVKNVDLLENFLKELVLDYKANGVEYAELSVADIIKPEWLSIVNRVLPELERSSGVKLRFLVGLWRHSEPAYNNGVIDKILEINNPYIVGVDFMGNETNSTKTFGREIKRLAAYRKKKNSKFQIRVHAGENANFPDNVKDAIKLGATRIGHGVYGVDAETIALAKQNDVIVELNTNSNLALQNINGREELPVREYLDADVRLTVATDGHGLYQTSPNSEVSVLKGKGLTARDLKKIRESDHRYVQDMLSEAPQENIIEQITKEKTKPSLNLRSCKDLFGG